MKKLFFLILVLSLFLYCSPKEEQIEKIIEDGIVHIKNPEKPIKGTVLLDIEKIREINPYKLEEVGFRQFRFARDVDGEVILLGINQTEVHRFAHNGDYLGSLVKKGQGPGEFPIK